MHLLYLTFGNRLSNHLQAAFSIYSFLQQRGNISSINIVTDAPAFYKHLSGHVEIINIDADTLKEWKGPHNFFWRAKIKAIEKVSRQFAGSAVMYLDTDTFLYKDIAALKSILQNGQAIMHENEGPLSLLPDQTCKRMWRHIRQRKFGGYIMEADDCMWNAGIVASPNTLDGKEYALALQICDEMCAAGVPNRMIEQYALSLALHHSYGLIEGQSFIAHYWSNKEEWDQFILEWLAEQQLKQKSFDEVIAAFSEVNLQQVAIIKRKRNMALRLRKWIDTAFIPRNITYLPKKEQ